MDGTPLPPTLASAASLLSQAPTHPAAAVYVAWLHDVMPGLHAGAAVGEGAAGSVAESTEAPAAKRVAGGDVPLPAAQQSGGNAVGAQEPAVDVPTDAAIDS